MLLVHGQEGTESHPFSAIIHLVLFSSWTAGWGWLPTSYQGKSKFSCETWKPFTINPDPASAPLTPFAKLTHWEAATPHLCCSPKCHICCMSLTWAHCSLCLHGSLTKIVTIPQGPSQMSSPGSLPQALQEWSICPTYRVLHLAFKYLQWCVWFSGKLQPIQEKE